MRHTALVMFFAYDLERARNVTLYPTLDQGGSGVQLFEEGLGSCPFRHDNDGGMWKSRLRSEEMWYEGLKAMYEGAGDEMVGTDNRQLRKNVHMRALLMSGTRS